MKDFKKLSIYNPDLDSTSATNHTTLIEDGSGRRGRLTALERGIMEDSHKAMLAIISRLKDIKVYAVYKCQHGECYMVSSLYLNKGDAEKIALAQLDAEISDTKMMQERFKQDGEISGVEYRDWEKSKIKDWWDGGYETSISIEEIQVLTGVTDETLSEIRTGLFR